MNFRSDSQRRAMFANMFSNKNVPNKFALQFDKDTDMVTSDEYPDVNFFFQSVGGSINKLKERDTPGKLKYLEDIPDQDFIGLKRMDVLTPKLVREAYDSDNSRYIFRKKAEETPMIVIRDTSDKSARADTFHEVGHHLERDMIKDLIKNNDPRIINVIEDRTANYYRETLTDKYGKGYAVDWQKDEIDYQKELARQKNITFEEAGGYADDVEFSFNSRRSGEWYPKDFNPPDNFPDIIRTYVSDIMQSKQFKSESGDIHYDMNDSRDISIMNGMVNQSLAENWNPEWGVKPSGRYIKADVEDAMEDLM